MRSIIIVLLLVWMSHQTSVLSGCPADHIPRDTWEGAFHRTLCCKKVLENCKPGYFVKKCEQDLGEDRCLPCPNGTYMLDITNSTYVHECVQYSCTSDTVMIDRLSSTGCHKPCACDTKRNFYGEDPCNCKMFQGSCPKGKELALNGTCVNSSAIYRVSPEDLGFRPKDDKPFNETYDNVVPEGPDEQPLYVIISLISVLVVVAVGIAVTLIIFYYKCKKRTQGDHTVVDKHSMSSGDSGISSDHETETKEKQAPDRDQTSIPLVIVNPMPRAHCNSSETTPMLENSRDVARMMVPSGSTSEYHVPYRDRSVEEN